MNEQHQRRLMKNKICIFIFLLNCFLFIQVKRLDALAITNEVTALASEKIKQSIQLLLHSQYLDSIDVTREIQALLPEHPAGYFYEAGVTEWMMSECRNYYYEKRFKKKISETIKKAKELLNDSPYDAWMYHYIGGAYGFLGVYHTEHNNWFSAFTIGTTGYDQLKHSVKLNPYLYDSYYGLGLYLYYKSRKAKELRWLPFLGNPEKIKEKGLEYLHTAMSNSIFIKEIARSAMTRIYLLENEYDKSIETLGASS